LYLPLAFRRFNRDEMFGFAFEVRKLLLSFLMNRLRDILICPLFLLCHNIFSRSLNLKRASQFVWTRVLNVV
jgi:hypothetical protein